MLIHAPNFQMAVAVTLFFWVIAMRCTAASTDELCKAVAMAVLDALAAAHIDPKDAADRMGLNLSRFYQQMKGEPENPIALWRLMKLPFTFWVVFAPWLMFRVTQKRMHECVDAIRELR